MSSESKEKRPLLIEYDSTEGNQPQNIVIPYSVFFRKQEVYIYSGEEKIPFQKRHPLYKVILLNEFRE